MTYDSDPSSEMLPPTDSWESWNNVLDDPSTTRDLQAHLRIAYTDTLGQRTHRSIQVRRFGLDEHGGGLLVAFCEMRQSMRPFQLARISHVADLDTATTIVDLAGWLDARYIATPLGERDAFLSLHEPALRALFYVAKADDAYRAKEKAAIVEFCTWAGLADTTVQSLVTEEIGRWPKPSAIQFGKDLQFVAALDVTYRERVLQTAKAIVATDKTVRENETRALDRMAKTMFNTRAAP